MPIHLALLRGINIGGHKKVPMANLRETFSTMGFENVRTVLATGNVIFEAEAEDPHTYSDQIASTLEDTYGFRIPVLLRPFSGIAKIIEINPFRAIAVSPKTKLNVTFLPGPPSTILPLPYTAPDGSFQILSIIDHTVFSVFDLDKTGTPDVMQFLEKEFGKNITTRTWKTVLRIGKKGQGA